LSSPLELDVASLRGPGHCRLTDSPARIDMALFLHRAVRLSAAVAGKDAYKTAPRGWAGEKAVILRRLQDNIARIYSMGRTLTKSYSIAQWTSHIFSAHQYGTATMFSYSGR